MPDGEPVARLVREADGLLGALDDLEIVATGPNVSSCANSESGGDVREQRGPVAGADDVATGEHARSVRDGLVDAPLDRRERVRGDQRAR